MAITITETTQADVAGLQVGVGNAWEDEYQTADGKTERGPTAMLSVSDEQGQRVLKQRVHAGQTVRFGGRDFKVEKVAAPDGGLGSVTLIEVQP